MRKQKGELAASGGKISNFGNYKFEAFTLVELLVVISIIAVLLAVLMPALNKAKKQARTVMCASNLKQWGLMYAMYCQDNNGNFFSGTIKDSLASVETDNGRYWRAIMKPMSRTEKMWLCPETLVPKGDTYMPKKNDPITTAWSYDKEVGSYGLNAWVLNPSTQFTTGVFDRPFSGSPGFPLKDYWRNCNVKGTNRIPVFADMWFTDAWPRDNDMPSQDAPAGSGKNCPGDTETFHNNEMQRICADRHGGYLDVVFMDWSAKKVGIKELWTLKWHKSYNTNGRYTLAGGYKNWPKWMQKYKNY
ncbi:MAG: hypothetical protein A2Y10_17300 [Planctomycetes bacterium GWF2_41_51]|nr:MAG: hypothetical protein A2Y10_17300 [Planctomycetes bacterium GWF2_41_51]HBG27983.1 hypothetical protein [Phycisphaerales bacterium]